MDGQTGPHARPLWVQLLLGLLVFAALLALLLIFFPWDWLRAPLNRYISERRLLWPRVATRIARSCRQPHWTWSACSG